MPTGHRPALRGIDYYSSKRITHETDRGTKAGCLGREGEKGPPEGLAGDFSGNFRAIEAIVTKETSADWWLAYKDKGLDVVCKQLLGGNLQRSKQKAKKRTGHNT
jgi:hypothetical protein